MSHKCCGMDMEYAVLGGGSLLWACQWKGMAHGFAEFYGRKWEFGELDWVLEDEEDDEGE